MVSGFESGALVYLDARVATNEGEGHAFHMTVGRIENRGENSNRFYVNFCRVGWTNYRLWSGKSGPLPQQEGTVLRGRRRVRHDRTRPSVPP